MRRGTHWRLGVLAAVVLLTGAAAGALFGERTLGSDEQAVITRSARVASTMVEWLPGEVDPARLVYDGIDGMLNHLDPHSTFLDPSTFQRMRARQEGSFFGVGIIISMRGGNVTVIAPVAGTPAAQKGLRAGDVISAVEGTSTEDMSLDDVVDAVRGPEGTEVELTILRPGLKEPMTMKISRTRIPTNSVRYAFMLRPDVGYIRLSEFSNTSVQEIHDALRQLESEGMQKLVLDLRDNPGGTLDAAVGIADTYLRKGQLVVSTNGRTPDSVSSYVAPGGAERYLGPMVILVNGGSASASEIVSGAVQDHDRGLVVGEVTWGKGLVQTVFTVRDAGLALTTARYYTPSGRCIQRDYNSFLDYITHRNGKPTPDAEVFHTDAGRPVVGGGGITPDVVVEARELSEPVARLYGQSAYFRFAIQQLQGVQESDKAGFAQRFTVTPSILDEFWSFVAGQELLEPDDLETLENDAQGVEDVKRAIHAEILNSTLGLEAGYRVAIGGDNQIAAALDHMDDAEGLWRKWQEAEQD